ncbi:Cytochrome P450 85A1 [Morella rubra]|uniref:Cytochrome P450 85A1 n=1 Tax=Morella rubra TaxID=262757 RepID=A0A6A1V6G0_9ROSI|nr:Cytochrome P450 85A1 [Morella rubra]
MKGRKIIIRILKQIVAERRASSTVQDNILAELLGNGRTKFHLNEEQIFDQVFTLLHSGYETVSTTSMMTLKYLHDHPKILEELREEHLALRERKRPEEPIDWNDFNSMRFTRAVILEASRLASIVNGVLRKTVKDVELNGFIIPKGWRIYVSTTNINYDPLHYPEPFKFNPWRWLADKSLESHNFCFLFGGGPRQCPGKEFGMFLVSSFLHYFVTRYSFAAFLYCLIDISGILYASTYILFFLAVLFGQSESFAKASILFADGSKSKK